MAEADVEILQQRYHGRCRGKDEGRIYRMHGCVSEEERKRDGNSWQRAEAPVERHHESEQPAGFVQDHRLIPATQTRRLMREWVLCYLVHYTGLYATIRGLILS